MPIHLEWLCWRVVAIALDADGCATLFQKSNFNSESVTNEDQVLAFFLFPSVHPFFFLFAFEFRSCMWLSLFFLSVLDADLLLYAVAPECGYLWGQILLRDQDCGDPGHCDARLGSGPS
jgi:hypothetical protein